MTALQRYTPSATTPGVLYADHHGDYVEYQPWMDRMRWRGIESAPTDGSMFLSWSREDGVATCQWTRARGWWIESAATTFSDTHPPTHWMPLPEAPR